MTYNTSLQGRTAIITGSGRNIGKSIALALAAQGANVVINGRENNELLQSVATEVRNLGAQALVVATDVSDALNVQSMVDQTVRHFGTIDIAISNVSQRVHQPFLEITLDDWHRVINTNLNSAFYLARACLPFMMENKWGRLIHISGRDGFSPKANRAHNVTAKAGVHALAKSIAIEFGSYGVTANTIAPGIINTQRDPKQYPNDAHNFEARRQQIPVRRLGTVQEIAGACNYLCSDLASFTTGQILHINGGEFMF